jgi:hypothetical protein
MDLTRHGTLSPFVAHAAAAMITCIYTEPARHRRAMT